MRILRLRNLRLNEIASLLPAGRSLAKTNLLCLCERAERSKQSCFIMSSLREKLESILFVATRPLTAKKIAELVAAKGDEVESALEAISRDLAERAGGVRLLRAGREWQMASSPGAGKIVQDFLHEEVTGELTRPQLETLTIIAYRGPITKPEIETIRGVNCSLILRNLMIRGLVEQGDGRDPILAKYQVTMDFVRFLGIRSVEDLPDYVRLHQAPELDAVLKQAKEEKAGQDKN